MVCKVEAAAKPNILLITIDTLRADHLGCYGSKSNASPVLDQFAKEGLRFEHAYTAVPLTLPSHASILSGLYPRNHGIRDNAHFPFRATWIQESLKASGYHSAAFVSGATLSSRFGLSRGFDFYDDEF
ncbi:MAG TPA: sulfatase-like hydrolase/transferase, partial [Acidobacteriota bacterium]